MHGPFEDTAAPANEKIEPANVSAVTAAAIAAAAAAAAVMRSTVATVEPIDPTSEFLNGKHISEHSLTAHQLAAFRQKQEQRPLNANYGQKHFAEVPKND